MSSTTKLSAVSRKHSGVYVQVPNSPFNLDNYRPLPASALVPAGSNAGSSKPLKENTPFRPFRKQMSQTSSTSSSALKRKLSDRDLASSVTDVAPSSFKKSKSASTGTPLKLSQINSPTRDFEPASNACPEFPNGWTYCHQCCKKRDLGATIHCTWLEIRHSGKNKDPKHKRCVAKFCKPCLQHRYGEDLDTWRSNRKREPGHIDNAGYIFKCPKCRDICNCPRCRKAKGLDPIGSMRKLGESASTKKEVKQDKGAQKAQPSAEPKKRPRKSKAKVVPSVKWTRIAPELSQEDAEERMHIREFVLRFNKHSDSPLPRPHLEELEQINGKHVGQDGHDPASWVSEACVKSVISMLLGLLAEGDSSVSRASKLAARNLKTVGFALNKVWGVLSEWQGWITDASEASSSSESSSISLAEPRPPAEYFLAQARRSTRTMTSGPQGSVTIHSSAQMISVILSLIELALETPTIRQDFEEGVKQGKDWTRKGREALKLEAERWDAVKKGLESSQDKTVLREEKQLHKDILVALENSSTIAQYETLVRFSPLGTDPDGRVYYALSAGQAEREAAIEYLDIMSEEVSANAKLKKKGRSLKHEDGDDLFDWSWMVLVWGKKPPSAYTLTQDRHADEDSDEDMEEESEGWWCFAQPSDIKQLAEWLAAENGLNEAEDKEKGTNSISVGAKQGQEPLKQLISSLKGFGTLLEWRSREDKYRLPNKRS